MAGRRSGEREEYWRGVIREQEASGLSISSFCRERDVSAASFFSWRRNLAKRPPEKSAAGFVALEMTPPASVAQQPVLEIVLPDGCRVLVSGSCDAPWLREILQVVRERGC